MASMHALDITMLGLTHESDATTVNMSVFNDLVRKHLPTIQRGDIVRLETQGWSNDQYYRDEWKYIWTGTEIMQLSAEPDDYGTVPPCFVVSETEFSPNWWLEHISHNNYWWPSQKIRAEAIANAHKEQQLYVTTFSLRSETWTVYLDNSSPLVTLDDFKECLAKCAYHTIIDEFSDISIRPLPARVCSVDVDPREARFNPPTAPRAPQMYVIEQTPLAELSSLDWVRQNQLRAFNAPYLWQTDTCICAAKILDTNIETSGTRYTLGEILRQQRLGTPVPVTWPTRKW